MSRFTNFGGASFSPEDYVYGICDVADITLAEIQIEKDHLRGHIESNAVALRANVNKNYANFIETAKETAKLEADMFELTNLLNEQSAILRGLNLTLSSAPSAPAAAAHSEGEKLTLADVQGIERAGLNPLATSDILHSGRVDLLDAETFAVRGSRYLFLLASTLVVTRFNKAGKSMRLVLEDVVAVATLTVSDPSPADSDSYHLMLQADDRGWLISGANASDKRAWLTAVRKAINRQRGNKEDGGEETQPSWLTDAPEDIEVFIAQRAFESAVDLVEQAQAELQGSANRLDALPSRMEACARRLADALCAEMQRPALRRHAIRATVQLLLRLDENEKACRAYLETWSQTLQREFRRLKMEGSTELFVFKLSQMFFGLLRSTCHEFGYLFDNSAKSSYVRWAEQQLLCFASVFARQVLESTTASLATVADCVGVALESCGALLADGLDLEFLLSEMLHPGIVHAIEEAGRSWISATAHHLSDETWASRKLASRQAQEALKKNLASYGIAHVEDYMEGNTCLLFEATVQFCVETREFFSSAARLLNLKTMAPVMSWTSNVFLLFINKMGQNFDGRDIFHVNAAFVLDFVLPAARTSYEQQHGGPIAALTVLAADVGKSWADASSEEGISHF